MIAERDIVRTRRDIRWPEDDRAPHTHLVWYPSEPGAQSLPQVAARSLDEARAVELDVIRRRPDLRSQDVGVLSLLESDMATRRLRA